MRRPNGIEGRRWSACITHVVLPLSVSALIYVSFRPTTLRLFDWAGSAGLGGVVARLRDAAAATAPADWVIYSLPNTLWAYALVCALQLAWRGEPGRGALAWWWLALLLVTGFEVGQLAGAVPGTFDPLDLLMAIGAVLLAGPALSVTHPTGPMRSGRRRPEATT